MSQESGMWPEMIRRLKGNMTQEQFARLLGLSQRSISGYLMGERKPGAKALQALLTFAPERREEILGVFLAERRRKRLNENTSKGEAR